MRIQKVLAELQDFYVLAVRSLAGLFRRPLYFRETVEQMDYAGSGSFLIVFLVSLFIGMALSLSISTELATMGLKMYTGKIVGIAIIREVGPVAIALSFAGRVGSGMASEIGSMVLGHQVDMLRVFGMDVVKKLVTPRVVSATLMLPILTVIGDAAALFGGYYISVFVSHQSGSFYWSQLAAVMSSKNIFIGLAKPFLFGYLVAVISCYMGLATRGGARGLREATTTAVVLSTIMILVANFVLIRLLFLVLGMDA